MGPAWRNYEQEADSVAKEVIGKLSSSNAEAPQRQEEELDMKAAAQRQEDEEELDMKPAGERLQRESSPLVQREPDLPTTGQGGTAPPAPAPQPTPEGYLARQATLLTLDESIGQGRAALSRAVTPAAQVGKLQNPSGVLDDSSKKQQMIIEVFKGRIEAGVKQKNLASGSQATGIGPFRL